MRLRTKLAIALLVITLVLSAATWGGLELYKRQQISEVESDITESAELAADGIATNIRQQRNKVGFAASRPEAANFSRSRTFAKQFLEANAEASFFAVQVIHRNGTVVAFQGDITEAARKRGLGENISDVPYFRCAADGGTCVTGLEYVNATDQYLVKVSAAIRGPPENDGDGTNEVEGVFTVAMYVTEQSVLGPASTLGTSNQRVTVRSGEELIYERGNVSGATITASHTIRGQGWTVRLSRDASSLQQELRGLALGQGIGLLIVLGSVIGFGYWQYNTSMRQAERLLQAFDRLSEGDYETSVSLTAGEEWEDISDGFNRLSTGLKRREEALRERQQRLEVLYRVLRHNLRNEMSVVLNYADIISDMTDDDQVEMAAGTILDTGRKLTDLSEKARQIQNALESADELESVEVADVLDDVVPGMREEYDAVDVRTDVADAPPVAAIPALEMAVENVVENACKHNDADEPHVEITSEREGDRVRLSVADNGPGIPEQERNVITKGRETALEHGSGLGLWLVYWVVDKSGGELDIEDNDPRGSVVTMWLPLASTVDESEFEPIDVAVGEGEATDDGEEAESETEAETEPLAE